MTLLGRIKTREFLFDAALAIGIFVLGFTTRVDVAEAGLGPYRSEPDALNALLIASGSGSGRCPGLGGAGPQGGEAERAPCYFLRIAPEMTT